MGTFRTMWISHVIQFNLQHKFSYRNLSTATASTHINTDLSNWSRTSQQIRRAHAKWRWIKRVFSRWKLKLIGGREEHANRMSGLNARRRRKCFTHASSNYTRLFNVEYIDSSHQPCCPQCHPITKATTTEPTTFLTNKTNQRTNNKNRLWFAEKLIEWQRLHSPILSLVNAHHCTQPTTDKIDVIRHARHSFSFRNEQN